MIVDPAAGQPGHHRELGPGRPGRGPLAGLGLGRAGRGVGGRSAVAVAGPAARREPVRQQQPGRAAVAAQRHRHHVRDPAGQPAHAGPGRLVDLQPRGRARWPWSSGWRRVWSCSGSASAGAAGCSSGAGRRPRRRSRRRSADPHLGMRRRMHRTAEGAVRTWPPCRRWYPGRSAAHDEHPEALARRSSFHRVPLLGQPALQGVRAQVLGHDEPRDPGRA